MLKPYTSLKEAGRSLFIQGSVLTAVLILFCLAGRLMAGNDFKTTLILPYRDEAPDPSELVFRWEGEAVPVRDFRVEKTAGRPGETTVLTMIMRPEKPGKFELNVEDRNGRDLSSERIRVGRMMTSFADSTGSFTGDETVIIASLLFYAGMCGITFVFFRRMKGGLAYSYPVIFSLGVFIFCLVALVIELPVYINHVRAPGLYPTWQILSDLAAGGKYFVLLTSPLLMVFSLLLIISNIELLRHERPRLQNVLGLLLGIIMIGAALLYYYQDRSPFYGSMKLYQIAATAENVIGIALTYVECILISTVICGLRAAKHVPSRDRDYILILGCGFRKDGTLPPLLKGRVEKAMEFWYRQKEETGKEAVVIPSGGQGANEPMPEAEAMYRHMAAAGFPESAVIREDKSANTYQNMEFSKKIIESDAADPSKAKTVFVTTNYHVLRSGIWAGLAGLDAEGLGSRTKWWFWPNAFVRECIGLLRNRIVPEIICLVLVSAVFAVMTVLTSF